MSVDGFVDKYAGQWGEVVRIFGCVVVTCAAMAAVSLYFGMALQVVGEAVGNDGALLDNAYALRFVAVDFVDE